LESHFWLSSYEGGCVAARHRGPDGEGSHWCPVPIIAGDGIVVVQGDPSDHLAFTSIQNVCEGDVEMTDVPGGPVSIHTANFPQIERHRL